MAWTVPATTTVGQLITAAFWNQQIRDNLLAAEPTGSLKFVIAAATSAETVHSGGWLQLNGATVSRATYATLWSWIVANGFSGGAPFGNGDGSTTFTLPDTHGRLPQNVSRAGGHGEAVTYGLTEGVALASRRTRHQHQTWWPSGGGDSLTRFLGEEGTTGTFDGSWVGARTAVGDLGGGPTDTPAYIVLGLWIVKF